MELFTKKWGFKTDPFSKKLELSPFETPPFG
jgi:hypothetical protein